MKGKNIMTSLAEIRAKLQQQESNSTQGPSGPNPIFPFWNIKEGESATIRFLPDGDPDNTFFWRERLMIKLPFAGIKGQTDSKPIVVQVPCMEMYGASCPILSEVRGWFKDPSLEDMGRKYWKKRSYIMQGFVRETPMNEDETPENPIRRFIISPQIFNVIKAALMDTEIEELPTDYDRGLDFWVTKTSKGGYSDYSTSKWARKETELTNEERAAIDAHGLFDLSDFLPKKPTDTELKVIHEMFEASVDGQPYDPELFGQYYKPAGMNFGSTSDNAPAPRPASTPAPQPATESVSDTGWQDPVEDDEPVAASAPVSAPTGDTSGKTADILAMIRQRKSAE